MSELERRELADRHRDELAEDAAMPIEPRRLGQMVSLRLEPEILFALREIASSRGLSVSELLREGAAMVIASNEQGLRVTNVSLGVHVSDTRQGQYDPGAGYTSNPTEIDAFVVRTAA